MVATAPFYKEGILIGCHITFRTSAAITLQEAFEESNNPHALVSSKSPHVISMVNEEFSRKFNCSRSQALGQALSMIQGPDSAGWTSLLRNACDGQMTRNKVSTRSSNARMHPDGTSLEDVICVPVVEAPNGKVRHVLIMFAPIAPLPAPTPLPIVSHYSPPRPLMPPALHPDDAAAPAAPAGAPPSPAESASFFSCPHRRGFGPAIFPRRKVALDGSVVPALPVVVTMELLSTLHDLPLHKAAEAIGVSATAFKKACRKLGVRRWTYKRRAGICGAGADPRELGDSGGSDDGSRPGSNTSPSSSPPQQQQYLPPPMPMPGPSAPSSQPRTHSMSQCPTGPDGSAVPASLDWAHLAGPGPIQLKPIRPPADCAARAAVRQEWGRDGPSGASIAAGRWAATLPGGGGGGGGGAGEDCPGSPVGPAPLFMEPPPAVDDSLVLDMLALQWPMHT